MAIAHEYDKSERREYIEAAYQLRLPYWDWIGEHAARSGLFLSFFLSSGQKT